MTQHVSTDSPQTGVNFYVKIDDTVATFDHQFVTGEEVLRIVQNDCYEDFDLYIEHTGCDLKLVGMSEKVDLSTYGIEKFHIKKKTGVTYYVKVDGAVITFDHRYVIGREVLMAVGMSPEDYDLNLKLHGGGRLEVGPNDKVDLGEDGIEKFHTIPKKRTDGRGGDIPPPLMISDVEYLNALGLEWEISPWQGNQLLIIRKWPLPKGYNVEFVDVALIIPITYPSAQIDMFYFLPSLCRLDGILPKAIANQNFNGADWQRWSRHRTSESNWRAGIDDLSSHLGLMNACLRDELGR